MYTPNGAVWYPFCLVCSNIACFRDDDVSCKWSLHRSGIITTTPNLFSECLLQKRTWDYECTHQAGETVMITLVWKTNCIRQIQQVITNALQSRSKGLPCSGMDISRIQLQKWWSVCRTSGREYLLVALLFFLHNVESGYQAHIII